MTQSNGGTRGQGAARPAGATKSKAAVRRRRRIPWKGLGLTLLALLLVGIGLAGLAYSMVDIPTPNEVAKAQTSIVFYADGKNELDRISEINRESVEISKIPEQTQHAVIAAEDRGFYDNVGISPTGLGRAVWGAIRGDDAGGGSTITQQYVKNYFLTSDQTLTRKGKEIIIAVKIERELSKDQILENYLNTIYYGRNAYGIRTASKAYFGKDVTDLDLAQSAFLAAVINQPSVLDPGLGAAARTRVTARWNYVLDGMVEQGWVTQAERSAATFPKTNRYVPKSAVGGPAGYLVGLVKEELLERGIKQEDIDRSGLRVVTTIDRSVQNKMVKAVDDSRPSSGRAAGVRVGAVAIKPKDGAILALYGGADFAEQQFNDATQAHMQAGSTMKAFGTLALLEEGKSTRTRFDSSTPLQLPGQPPINNWDFQSHGQVDVRRMLAGSINTAFVRLNEEVGPENTMKAAIKAGLPPEDAEAPANSPGLEANVGNILGSASVRPLDMANAYATIAAEGQRARPYIVRSVQTADGKPIYQSGPELTKAFERDVAVDTTNALRAVVEEGTGSGASALGRPVAGKTGTSSESLSAWFVGYTPEVSTAIAMYLPDKDNNPQSMNGLAGLESGALPVTVWTEFTRDYLQGKPVTNFPERVGIGDDRVYAPPPSTSSAPTTTTTTTTPSTTTTTAPPTTQTTTAPGSTGTPIPPRGTESAPPTVGPPPATRAVGVPTTPSTAPTPAASGR